MVEPSRAARLGRPVAMLAMLFMGGAHVDGLLHAAERRDEAQRLPVLRDVGGDFVLSAAGGRRIGLEDFRGRAVLLFFGYASCPDVCPTTLVTLKQVMQRLGGNAARTQVLMITVDPQRDTPEMLETYVAHFHPAFIGLSGTAADIAKVAKLYDVFYEHERAPPGEGYMVAHTSFVYLLDPKGRVRALYDARTLPKRIAADVRRVQRGE